MKTYVRKDDQVLNFNILVSSMFWKMSRCPWLNTKSQIVTLKESGTAMVFSHFSSSLSTETKCWHHGTNSAFIWIDLIPLIMLKIKKNLLGQGAECGAYRNLCCCIWTPEPICFSLLDMFILDLFSLLFVVSFTVSTRKHPSEMKRTLSFYTMTSDTWLVLGLPGFWVSFFVPDWGMLINIQQIKKLLFLKNDKPKP